jgi:filamentous hemagglutinin family protein
MLRHRRRVLLAALALAGGLLPPATGRAQITLDGSMVPGTAGPLTGPGFVIPSAVGRTVGSNLFHSFGQFSLQAGQSATFTGPVSIGNVISRVTGGQLSSINGLIDTRSAMPNASFYLLNPAGVLLGPNASLNVGGAVHFSTAGYLCLGAAGCLNDPTSGKFFATLGPESVLTAAAPAAFGFLPGVPPGPITVDGANLLANVVDPPVGQTISLVGGQIQVTGSTIAPPGGRVQLVGVNSGGEVAIPSLDVSSFSSLAPVSISGSTIDVSAAPGGSVAIRGGSLTIDTATILAGSGTVDAAVTDAMTVSLSLIDASGDPGGSVSLRGGDVLVDLSSITASTGFLDAPPVAIDLQGTSSVSLSGSGVMSATFGDGRAGKVQLTAPSVALSTGAVVLSEKAGAGAGADISIAANTVTMTDASAVISQRDAPGDQPGGSISVTATGTMTMSTASTVLSVANAGDGAAIAVSAGTLAMDGGASINSITNDGHGGTVGVTAAGLNMSSGAQIQSQTFGVGQGGAVSVAVSQSALIQDPFTGITTGSFAAPNPADPTAPVPGAPGDILGQFGSLTVTGGANIQSGVFAGTVGGARITVVATGPILLSNGGGIVNTAFFGDVGPIEISAPQLSLNGGFVSTATLQSGNAGGILINAGALTLTGGGQIVTASIDQATGLGGDVTVNAGSLTISGSSPSGLSVLPSPFNDVFTDSRSGIFSTAAAAGPGGNITIRAPQIQILDGGTISAASTSLSPLATAGSIAIAFGDQFSMNGSNISTEALVADGGNITITATGSVLLLTDSQITTSVQSGTGGGGNIFVGTSGQPVQFIVLNNGGIHADAFGGPGGNINIFTTALFSSTPVETAVTASSQLSSPGIISISAVLTDVSGSLVELPSALVEAAALLRASCAARLAAGKASSFVIAGREGIPPEPGGLLPSALAPAGSAGTAASAGRFLSTELPALRLSYLDPKCGG